MLPERLVEWQSSSEGMRLGWRHPGSTVWNLLHYTKTENAQKARNKRLLFIMWLLHVQLLRGQNRYGFVWAVIINPPELPFSQLMTKLEMIHILQAQVCGCVSTHPRLLATSKKTNGKLVTLQKSQLHQARWNRTVLQFGSENQLNLQNYLSIPFCDFL